MSKRTIYLGDAVYATWNGYMMELKTDNPDDPDNVIYLEDWVMEALAHFYKSVIEDEATDED